MAGRSLTHHKQIPQQDYEGRIAIKNTQRAVPLNRSEIKKIVRVCLTELGYADFDIGIWFTTSATIQKYNAQYRNKDNPTDILSFAYHPELKPGQRIVVTMPEDRNLGDLILCPTYIEKKAPEYGHSFNKHLQMLLIHGICHLLGYDHETDKDYKKMATLEQQLATAITRSIKSRAD